ncbi:DEAD/DEAH box helicase [Pseudocnuella soli]|uniref:DEAD/DEAH box helicase n=1 Tax=Pseudocnuella soli TaxID=2502779 RepID=UPI001EFFE0DE|nr:DEAD/DEAH box helicase [Pseudocnuella soli]
MNMRFEDFKLEKRLLNALTGLGYATPTTIQERVFSVVMSGADVCGIAQTGTGKTLAYLLPLLNQWKYSKTKDPQILVLVPTRELVVQVVDAVNRLAAQLSVTTIGLYGGVNINTQRLELQPGCNVLVATPGRLYDLAVTGAFKIKAIKKLVIDEVDEMLALGFRPQLQNIMDLLPQRRQNLLFSATLTEDVSALLDTYFDNPVRVEAAPAGTPLKQIEQAAYEVPNFYTKVALLQLLLREDHTMSKVLVFAATKSLADDLFAELEPAFGDSIGIIHSNKAQNDRFQTVERFKDGTYRLIIATDIVARGIDIAEVTHVVNFDLPESPENYMHRIGRTGRADHQGHAISFITERDSAAKEEIEAFMQLQIPVLDLPPHLAISTRLTDDELPKVHMKVPPVDLPKKEDRGASFHQKSAKNMKVNVRVSHKEKMMLKYGKPKKRPGKK